MTQPFSNFNCGLVKKKPAEVRVQMIAPIVLFMDVIVYLRRKFVNFMWFSQSLLT